MKIHNLSICTIGKNKKGYGDFISILFKLQFLNLIGEICENSENENIVITIQDIQNENVRRIINSAHKLAIWTEDN